MVAIVTNPANLAAQTAMAHLKSCLDQRESFIFEAGAGAGKTFSLIEALRYLTKKDGAALLRNHQRIACITYTNVATNEIETRTDRHPVIYSSTIHAFCWTLIKDFQPFLRQEISSIPGWMERLKESAKKIAGQVAENGLPMMGNNVTDVTAIPINPNQDVGQFEVVGQRNVEYSLGHPRGERHSVSLGHNDVLVLAAKLLANPKFRQILASRFPVIFIDEYQDTDKAIVDALKENVIGSKGSPLIGFFGDHWQKIYGSGCGMISHPVLKRIGKRANFRSVPTIVSCLNRIRPELPQEVENPDLKGSVVVFNTNDWRGNRRNGGHWGGDLPANIAHSYLEMVKKKLVDSGWDLAPGTSKILMLTHNILAAEQGYQQLADAFDRNDSFVKKEDPHIAFLVDVIEPVSSAFENKKYGEMLSYLGGPALAVRSHSDKTVWSDHIASLVRLRNAGTIGSVIDHLRSGQRVPVPDSVERKESLLEKRVTLLKPGEAEEIERLRALRAVPYIQVKALADFIDEKTPFSTKHGVKGAEFENVLVVFGRGWNIYNFSQYLEWAGAAQVPADKVDSYERNRNLFYVACSRPKRRLALLFTQELTAGALKTLENWFGKTSIHSLPNLYP